MDWERRLKSDFFFSNLSNRTDRSDLLDLFACLHSVKWFFFCPAWQAVTRSLVPSFVKLSFPQPRVSASSSSFHPILSWSVKNKSFLCLLFHPNFRQIPTCWLTPVVSVRIGFFEVYLSINPSIDIRSIGRWCWNILIACFVETVLSSAVLLLVVSKFVCVWVCGWPS